MTDGFIEQYDDFAKVVQRLEQSEAAQEEWLARLVNSAAAANGAGLITLTGYLAAKDLPVGLAYTAGASACMFLLGLTVSARTMAAMRKFHEVEAMRHSNKVQHHKFEQDFRPVLEEDGDRRFADHISALRQSEMLHLSTTSSTLESKREVWLTWGFIWFSLGFLIALVAVVSATVLQSRGHSDQILIQPFF